MHGGRRREPSPASTFRCSREAPAPFRWPASCVLLARELPADTAVAQLEGPWLDWTVQGRRGPIHYRFRAAR